MSIVEYAWNAFRKYMTEMNHHYEAGHIEDAQDAANRAQFFREIVLLSAERPLDDDLGRSHGRLHDSVPSDLGHPVWSHPLFAHLGNQLAHG